MINCARHIADLRIPPANRLARFFGTSAEFWLGLQSQYDLDVATDKLGDRLVQEVKEFSKAKEHTAF